MVKVTSAALAVEISGKQLGALSLPDYCPRCTYLQLRMRHKMPYQKFPGIFSSIDSFTKKLVRSWWADYAQPPPWLAELGAVRPCDKVPHHSSFRMFDTQYNTLLTGTPDEILLLKDGCIIVDYKCAKYTKAQDSLLSMYAVQLHCYARICEAVCNYGPVKGLWLVYLAPQTNGEYDFTACCTTKGMVMPFAAHMVEIDLKPGLIDPLLSKARELYNLQAPPPSRPGCENCDLLNEVIEEALRRPEIVDRLLICGRIECAHLTGFIRAQPFYFPPQLTPAAHYHKSVGLYDSPSIHRCLRPAHAPHEFRGCAAVRTFTGTAVPPGTYLPPSSPLTACPSRGHHP